MTARPGACGAAYGGVKVGVAVGVTIDVGVGAAATIARSSIHQTVVESPAYGLVCR